MTIPCDYQKLHETSRNLGKYVLDCIFPRHQNHMYSDLSLASLEQFLRAT